MTSMLATSRTLAAAACWAGVATVNAPQPPPPSYGGGWGGGKQHKLLSPISDLKPEAYRLGLSPSPPPPYDGGGGRGRCSALLGAVAWRDLLLGRVLGRGVLDDRFDDRIVG